MGILKKWRRKMRGQTPVAIDDSRPETVFKWQIGRLCFARNPLLIDISCYRRVFPNESIGTLRSRLWWRGYFAPDDVVQVTPDASPNFGGCCMIVTDCGEDNVYGYILAPSRDGRVGIDMCLPKADVVKLGRAAFKSDRIRLAGGNR